MHIPHLRPNLRGSLNERDERKFSRAPTLIRGASILCSQSRQCPFGSFRTWVLAGIRESLPYGEQGPFSVSPFCPKNSDLKKSALRFEVKVGPHAAASAATERYAGREPLRTPPHNFHDPGHTRSRTESAGGHLAGIHRGPHRAPGRQDYHVSWESLQRRHYGRWIQFT